MSTFESHRGRPVLVMALGLLTGWAPIPSAHAEDTGREIPVVRGKAEKSPQAASLTARVIPYVLDSGPLDNPSD
ncbi:MAG: hypothetical protein AABZ47_07455, partial [Planctomycetota bacterium]